MAQGAHVPKFGNWDGDNIPYTAYFENARKDKGVGTKIFNPNDPEENPDAFTSGIFPPKHELKKDNYGDHLVKQPPKKYAGKFAQGYVEDSELNKPVYQSFDVELPGRNHKSSNPGPDSDKSSSAISLRSPRHSRPSKHSAGGSFGTPSPKQQSMLKSGKSPNRDTLDVKSLSVPKFGAWSENDPRSGDGFTVIFNKVKHEKQIAATKLPVVPTEQTIYPIRQRERSQPSSRSKICCLCPSTSE